MLVAYTKPLFAWDCLEDSPSLQTIKAFLATLPDGQLLDGLRQARGRGRNDYPVHVLWGTVLLTVILRHPNWEACLADLRRNEALRRLIGIRSEEAVPKKRLDLPARRGAQQAEGVRPHGACQVRDRPEAVSSHPPRDEEVRATL